MQKEYKYHFLLSISYDGSSFNGWIIQPNNTRTVQGTLEKGIKKLIKKASFYIAGASKTDSGVHAIDQKVLLCLDFLPVDLNNFKNGLNNSLPLDIRINSIQNINKDFSVRNVKSKEYEYIINDQLFNVFSQRYELSWKYQQIDIKKLQDIFSLFVGKHDFFNFSGLSYAEKNNFKTKRTIDEISVKRNENNKVSITFKAKGFIRYQIRMIVAASLQCYLNNSRSSVELIKQRLTKTDNKSPFNIAPNGLILKKIEY